MGTFDASADLRGAEFVGLDMSETVFREVNLIGARMHGVLLMNADIDGAIDGLRLNGVEVLPLIEAELDRRHPERTRLRPTTPEGMRKALATVESFWAPTMARADALPPGGVDRSVNGEWSFAETLRHLVFVTDAWFGHAVLGETRPFHPLGVPASFITNGPEFGIDTAARPSFSDVIAARADRLARLGAFLAGVSQEELDRPREPNDAPGWPPPEVRTAMSCLQVILNEEWAHHQFAVRDLAVIEAG